MNIWFSFLNVPEVYAIYRWYTQLILWIPCIIAHAIVGFKKKLSWWLTHLPKRFFAHVEKFFESIPAPHPIWDLFMRSVVVPPILVVGIITAPIGIVIGTAPDFSPAFTDELFLSANLLEYAEDVSQVALERAESVKNEAEPVYHSPTDSVEKKYENKPVHCSHQIMLLCVLMTLGMLFPIAAVEIDNRYING